MNLIQQQIAPLLRKTRIEASNQAFSTGQKSCDLLRLSFYNL
jgi:hypothetical protein